MANPVYVLGIDPGPMTGIVGLVVDANGLLSKDDVDVVQCSGNRAGDLVHHLLWLAQTNQGPDIAVAVERFVIGRASMRAGKAGEVTRRVIEDVSDEAFSAGALLIARNASEVKPWATDERLASVGLFQATVGMRHARDAARHALFAACRDFGHADPLSKKAGGRP